MKKVYISVATAMIVFAMVSCYRDDLALNNGDGRNDDPLTKANGYLARDNNAKMVSVHKITPERARQIAVKVPVMFNENADRARSIPKQVADIIAIVDPVQSKTRSTVNSNDTLMHVVNYAGNQGFAVISFDDRDGDVLAYFEEGNFNLQDTTEDSALKLHIDMIMAHQKSTRDKIQTALELDEKYVGKAEFIESSDEIQPSLMAAGAPGMPGNPGKPGMPGQGVNETRITTFHSIWEGNDDVIEEVNRKCPSYTDFYRMEKVPLPAIHFATGPIQGQLGPETPCPSAPYCNPPLWNWDQYFLSYGATFKTTNRLYTLFEYRAPFLKTLWHQGLPLKTYSPKCQNPLHLTWFCRVPAAGCVPIALGQLMAYYEYPESYVDSNGHIVMFNMKKLSLCKYNESISSAGLGDEAALFIRQIGRRLDVTYMCGGSGPISLYKDMDIVRSTLESFNYTYGTSFDVDFMNPGNFELVKKSIINGQPVIMLGFRRGWTGILNYFNGHCWLLDGYLKSATTKTDYTTYYFNEDSNIVNIEMETYYYSYGEYVHANLGNQNQVWVLRGVYDNWDGDDYSGRLTFIPGIKPKPLL